MGRVDISRHDPTDVDRCHHGIRNSHRREIEPGGCIVKHVESAVKKHGISINTL